MMKNILAVMVLGAAVAALTMLAKSKLVLMFLSTALLFAATALPAFAWVALNFVV